MIGVSVPATERAAVHEFFELCKTPWEFAQPETRYDVLIFTGDAQPFLGARLVLFFSSSREAFDKACGVRVITGRGSTTLLYDRDRIPIHGTVATFPGQSPAALVEETSGEPSLCRVETAPQVLRLGYDLFQEVRFLLTVGQPAPYAGTPTLELHIELLRRLITAMGLPFVEIPPVPHGYTFIACLTHDIDHPRLRCHLCDHTAAGFVFRATIGSWIDYFRHRRSARQAWRNTASAARLPLVYLGLAHDPWENFDRYAQIEEGCLSTYFVIPIAHEPGKLDDRPAPSSRAASYDLKEVEPQLHRLLSRGNEVGVHGLDAWCDERSGRTERALLAQIIGRESEGIRMHWLYFGLDSPALLERAGYAYDSTVGYNETVGYRAGTGQVYQPFGCTRLLELPLQVMDTALFYPKYLHLSSAEAHATVDPLLGYAARFGGTVTVNWHDRSIAPERLWEGFYADLLSKMRGQGAWFAPAAQAVAWFKKRRGTSFALSRIAPGVTSLRVLAPVADALPELKLRIHRRPPSAKQASLDLTSAPYSDVKFDRDVTLELSP